MLRQIVIFALFTSAAAINCKLCGQAKFAGTAPEDTRPDNFKCQNALDFGTNIDCGTTGSAGNTVNSRCQYVGVKWAWWADLGMETIVNIAGAALPDNYRMPMYMRYCTVQAMEYGCYTQAEVDKLLQQLYELGSGALAAQAGVALPFKLDVSLLKVVIEFEADCCNTDYCNAGNTLMASLTLLLSFVFV